MGLGARSKAPSSGVARNRKIRFQSFVPANFASKVFDAAQQLGQGRHEQREHRLRHAKVLLVAASGNNLAVGEKFAKNGSAVEVPGSDRFGAALQLQS